MKLINPYFEILEQEPTIEGMYKQIELAGRTCYKSEDKITETSAKEFVDRMIASGHGAMLEHGTVYLKMHGYANSALYIEDSEHSRCTFDDDGDVLITTNFRVLVEKDRIDDLKYWYYSEHHLKRYTVKWHCSRGIDDEFFRHRTLARVDDWHEYSYAQESTRYCNYSKNKFDNQVSFVIPREFSNIIHEAVYDEDTIAALVDEHGNCAESEFLYSLYDSESVYIDLVNHRGVKAQIARDVLPLATKSELVMTGFLDNWEHFFELRTDSAAHPDAKYLADNLAWEFYKRNYFDE